MNKNELKATKNKLSTSTTENEALKQQVAELESKLTAANSQENQSSDSNEKVKELEKQLTEEKSKFTDLEKEQEDLLVCMGKESILLFVREYVLKLSIDMIT